jgi:hypothetical protein
MLIDYLLSKDGVRVDHVDISLAGLRLNRTSIGFAPHQADALYGTLRVTLSDLSAAITRPEIIDALLAGVPGRARPDFQLTNGDDGGIKIVGSVEALGRRIPITTSTRIRVANNRLVLSPVKLQGIPVISSLPIQLPDLELPLNLPYGMSFTDVRTEPGSLVLKFEGRDITFIDSERDDDESEDE